MKERGDVALVGLKLVVGRADVGIGGFGSLEFDDHHRQAVEKNHDVRSAVGRANDRELIHREPIVLRIAPVHKPEAIVNGFTAALVADRHAIDHQPMETHVFLNQLMEHPVAQGIHSGIHGIRRGLGIEPLNSCFQPLGKDRAMVAFPFRRLFRIE